MNKLLAMRVGAAGFAVATASALAACSGGSQTSSLPSLSPNGATLAAPQSISRVGTTQQTSAPLTYEATVMQSNPVAFFELADTSSMMKNDVNSSQNGSYGSAVGHNGPSLTWEGKASAAFPGSDGDSQTFAQTASMSVLQPSPAFSIELLAQSGNAKSTKMRGIVAYGSDKVGAAYELDVTPRNTLKWTISGGAPYFNWGYEGHLPFAPGMPHHILADYDGTTMHVYLDGQVDIVKKAPGPINYHNGTKSPAGLAVGGLTDGSQPTFDGALADVAVYPRVLTAAELANHVALFRSAPSNPSPSPAPSSTPTAVPTSTPIPNQITETPQTVHAFTDSVGVVAHFDYHDAPYYGLAPEYVSLIEAMHVHNLRGEPNAGAYQNSLFAGMCANGVKHTVAVNVGVTAEIVSNLINRYGVNCVDAIEPSNEYDAWAFNPAHPDPNWIETIKNETRTLYNIMKSNPAWNSITVLGPSLASESRYALLGNMESISDAGNQHDGTCDGSPLTTHYKNIAHNLALVRAAYPTKPIWTGETNYANNPATSRCAVSKEVAAKYIPRMYLDRFNIGIPHTFLYELSDDAAEGPGWGTLGVTDNHANPWPAYYSLQGLLGSLPQSEPASNTVSQLSYAITGSTNGLAHTLLQSSDGTYYLVYWLEIDSWDVKRKSEIANAPQPITLDIPRSFRNATLYVPNAQHGMTKSSFGVNGSIPLSAIDSPSIIAFK